MEIKRIESQPTRKGSAEWFTGSVRIQSLFEAPKPALVRGASATSTKAITHIAIQEALDDEVAEWMEQVTDKEYRLGEQERRKSNNAGR